TTNELDIDDADGLDGRHVRTPPKRKDQTKWERKRNAEGGEDQRQRQSAPFRIFYVLESEYTAPHQDGDRTERHQPHPTQSRPPEAPHATAHDDADEDDAGK